MLDSPLWIETHTKVFCYEDEYANNESLYTDNYRVIRWNVHYNSLTRYQCIDFGI